MNKSTKKKLTIIFLISSALILLIFYFFYFPQYPFESGKWKSGDKRIRGSMVRDLDERKLLIGKSAPEIINILGKPDAQLDGDFRYFVDLDTKYGSSPWLYYFDVIIDSTTQRVSATTYGD